MGSRILVIDDSATIRRVAERALAGAGFEVLVAADGREGLEVASAKVPDLVVTDFVMPHLNGFQLVQALRGIANLARVPVVLMSAKADRIGEGFVAQTGALDAITKPFSPEALIAVVTHAIARAGERAASSSGSLAAPVTAPRDDDPDTSARDAEHAHLAARIADRIAHAAAESAGIDPATLAARIAERLAPDTLLSIAAEIGEAVPGLRGEVGFEGRMEHVPLGEILQMLQHQRQTGVLEIRRGGDGSRTVAVCMSNGTIDLAIGRAHEEEFLLGRYLVEEELLDKDDLARLIEGKQAGPRTLLGARLVKLGYISQDDLSRALVRQTSELVYEALRWRQGTYRFVRLATRPEASAARLALPIGSILMEGLRRVDEWRLIEEQIRSYDEVLRVDREAIAGVDLDRLSREERAVLAAVDGHRSVREIVAHTRMGSFEVSKILFQLLTSRLLRRA